MNREAIFRERFAAILADMKGAEATSEHMAAVGGLANMFTSRAGQANWTGFKANISKTDYDAILAMMQKQGNRLAREGNTRQVRAIETLAVSLIAKTQIRDADIAADAVILDNLIDRALSAYHASTPVSPIIT